MDVWCRKEYSPARSALPTACNGPMRDGKAFNGSESVVVQKLDVVLFVFHAAGGKKEEEETTTSKADDDETTADR